MAKINPNASILIDTYIENLPPFSNEICTCIRALIHQANHDIVEDWKWKTPIFSTSKMICGMAAFKKHISLTFFEGAFMSNQHNLFSEDCTGQKTRTIKFKSIDELNKKQLLEYFNEALLLKTPDAKKRVPAKIIIPDLLQEALNSNELAKNNFNNMAYTYQKEYANHIAQAKRDTTKISRLKKVILNLEKNIKMHEQYKC